MCAALDASTVLLAVGWAWDFHRFEVPGDAFLADAVVDPIPVTTWAGVRWGIGESRPEVRTLGMGTRQFRDGGQQNKDGTTHGFAMWMAGGFLPETEWIDKPMPSRRNKQTHVALIL
jgi:hypothetical protein